MNQYQCQPTIDVPPVPLKPSIPRHLVKNDAITTLAEAIRIGALLKPQCRGEIFKKENGATCAIGAALDTFEEVINLDRQDLITPSAARKLEKYLPYLKEKNVSIFLLSCNDVITSKWSWDDLIVDLNDALRLPRELIADAVEHLGL